MSDLAIKHLHLTCVALSYALFVLRGIWHWQHSARLQQRWIKITPHLIDTVLLASAVTLAFRLSLSPLETPWLFAKIIALMLYIVLGSIALKHGKTQSLRVSAWFAAQGIFAYIVATAMTHNPLPWEMLSTSP